MRLLLQFLTILSTLLIVNPLLNRTKDEKRAFLLQQIKICKGFIQLGKSDGSNWKPAPGNDGPLCVQIQELNGDVANQMQFG